MFSAEFRVCEASLCGKGWVGFCHQELLVIAGGIVLASPGKAKEGGGKNRRTVLRRSATGDDR